MKKLKKIVEFYIVKNENIEEKNGMFNYARNGLIDDIKKEIEPQIKEKLNKEFEKKKDLERLKRIKLIIIEAIMLGFFIGMVVNQSTNLLEKLNPNNQLSWILAFIVIFSLIIYSIYKYKVLESIIEYFEKRGK